VTLMSATRLRRRYFGTPGTAIVTLVMLALFVWATPPVLRWAIFDAKFEVQSPSECLRAAGACWAFIGEKYRLIIFGRYPYDEQWRPLLAMLVMIGLVLFGCHRVVSRRYFLSAIALGLPLVAILMWGGIFGLTYVQTARWGGLPLTLILSITGIVFAFPLAVALALGRQSSLPFVTGASTAFIETIRGVPLVSVLFMASFMIPLFLPSGIQVNELLRAQAAIILFGAAYLAEAIRGGLQAVPRGQISAGQALGLKPGQISVLIVVPQALRIAIPSIVNVFVALFKDTSLVGIVGLMDLLLSSKQALGDVAWRSFSLEAYLFVAGLYFIFCFYISRRARSLEHNVNQSGRVQE
jgi:general L-amino acid transport system permease protein